MNLTHKIEVFAELGIKLKSLPDDELKKWCINAEIKNSWFTEDNVRNSLENCITFLDENELNKWVSKYNFTSEKLKKVGLILAGNIPLVGFHDILSVLISGNIALIKLSSEDNYLIKEILKILVKLEPKFIARFEYVEMLKEAEAFIATGSNNSNRYFEKYFSGKPNIIRGNRTSVAVLSGKETKEELMQLSNDVFQYFGLGCRNVSKILVPKNFILDPVFEAFEHWNFLFNHNKYTNNFTYNKSIYLLGKEQFLENGFFILKESEELVAPVGVVFVEFYNNRTHLNAIIERMLPNLQCIASQDKSINQAIPFGTLQKPSLLDYADGVDTMHFLTNI